MQVATPAGGQCSFQSPRLSVRPWCAMSHNRFVASPDSFTVDGMPTPSFGEIAPGTYVRRHTELDLNCGLVVGSKRALVIDTRSTATRGEELAAAVREITPLEQVVG